MTDNFKKLDKIPTIKSLDTKVRRLTNVIKDPDGYNSGIASSKRIEKVEERVDELTAISHPPVDFSHKLDSLHHKIDRMIEMLERLTDEQSN
jgi:hypothetical protein